MRFWDAPSFSTSMAGMSDPVTDHPICTPIRSFSDLVEAEQLYGETGKALAHHVKAENDQERKAEEDAIRWKLWWASALAGTSSFETNEDEELLRHCQELTALWKDFRKSKVFQKAKFQPATDNIESMPPSIDSLLQGAKIQREDWSKRTETRWGEFKSKLRAFGEKLETHKTLFSFFPSENIYTGVITGVVSTILTCCVTYQTVADEFSRAMQQITDYFAFVRTSGHVVSMLMERKAAPLHTKIVRMAICRAYVPVFKFLCHAITWHASTRHRWISSFNAKYDEEVKEFVQDVKHHADMVDRYLSQAIAVDSNIGLHQTMAELSLQRDAQKSAADRNRQLTSGEVGNTFACSANLLGEEVGRNITQTFTAAEHQHDHGVDVTTVHRDLLQLVASDKTMTDDSPNEEEDSDSPPLRHYARIEIQGYIQSLTQFTEDGKANALQSLSTIPGSSIPQEVLIDVQKWLRLDKTALLWVEGPVTSDLSTTALQVSLVTSNAGVPCISFFDKARYAFASSKSSLSQKEAGIIALLFTLITQLVNLLPPSFATELDFDENQFSRLDGTWESVNPALNIIRALLRHAPPSIVCVVDGIQSLEVKQTKRYLQELVDILREQGDSTVVKVLFTTDGMSQTLAKKMKGRERVSAASWNAEKGV
ncbi:hypothetical protein QBC43DRAFT_316153 [Cladorrhinum sp. PSN259]|nr:hypothetical protein QBC43DRAFT_316153 [Cladorrhinum sp. PSN259]